MTKTQHINRESRLYSDKVKRVGVEPMKSSVVKRIVSPVAATITEIWSNVVIVQTKDGQKGRVSREIVPGSADCGDEIVVMVKQKETDKLRAAALRSALRKGEQE